LSERAPNGTKRLLVVMTSFCAEGTPILALDLCRRWKAMGIDPTVVTLLAAPTELEPEFVRENIAVRKMNLSGSGGRRRFARMVAFTYRLCRRHRPDALLSMPFGWHAFLAYGARLAGVGKVAAHVGNYPPHEAGRAFSKFRLLVQAGRPVTTKLICCSAYVQQGVVEHFGVPVGETVVIYNGVDVGSISRRAHAAPARDGHGAFVVGMVARLEGHKDQPTLIRAAKILKDSGRPIEVWLIGEGSRRLEYERLIGELGVADQVKLLGVRRDIPELLARLDAFAFAVNPDEGLGVALVEAMAAGVPIVAADVGACREVLDGGDLAPLVAPADPGALAAAIDRLRDNPGALAPRLERARRKAVEAFSIDSMAESYARCLGLL
jgi:glycosyltransferase involved in cell wall biosynthesis